MNASDLTVVAAARAAKKASKVLALLTRAQKDAALHVLADAIVGASAKIRRANELDLQRGRAGGMSSSLQDRLRLDETRIGDIAQALRDLAALPDPVGEVVRGSTLANGLTVRQVRVPLGVIGMIYEARPNVTVDASGLGLKSGNAMVLRGGSAAAESNAALVEVLRDALTLQGLPANAVVLLNGGHEQVQELITARDHVDLVIPRGGQQLIQTVVENATVPVIETGVGNVHVYVDAGADIDMAESIVINAKVQRPSVCNAAETLLVHAEIAERFLARVLPSLHEAGVVLHADLATEAIAQDLGIATVPATDADWATEYHGLELAVNVVQNLERALQHIDHYSSRHTEVIVTNDRAASRRFVAEVDAAAVMVNASSRFTDGGQFGFGAEIGISTQKMHARGPMALAEMTSTKWVVEGDGQVRT